MIGLLRRWFGARPAAVDVDGLAAWCEQHGHRLKSTVERDGIVVEGDAMSWRLEWGPSHRRYLGSHELRLRGDTGIDPLTYGVVMPRALMASLQHALYSEFTEGVKTRADDATPEEVRWLAMAPRLSAAELGSLNDRLAAVGNVTPGPVGMAARSDRACAPGLPWPHRPRRRSPSSSQHGHLVFRQAMPAPDLAAVARAVGPVRRGLGASPAPGSIAAPVNAPVGATCGRDQAACLPNSILAMALRCTSSGPSAKRSVRARV